MMSSLLGILVGYGSERRGWRCLLPSGKIVTSRDVRFEPNLEAKVESIMTPRDRLVTVKEDFELDEIQQVRDQDPRALADLGGRRRRRRDERDLQGSSTPAGCAPASVVSRRRTEVR